MHIWGIGGGGGRESPVIVASSELYSRDDENGKFGFIFLKYSEAPVLFQGTHHPQLR